MSDMKTAEEINSTAVPLVVDLDGTLLRSDMLFETGMAFVRTSPLHVLKPFVWLVGGKAELKAGLAKMCHIDVSTLPYDPVVIELIETERRSGRRVVLATACYRSLADRIAEHLQLFDEVFATDVDCNLSAHRKRDLLISQYGMQGFDYVGNSRDDLCVWEAARKAYIVNPEVGVLPRVKGLVVDVEQIIHSNTARPKDWLKALRLHQWMKNSLIFVPLLAAHQLANPVLLWQGLLAFLFFGLCASSVYLLNDMLDLADDRHHPTKCNRPFASGRLPIKSGLIAFPALLAASFAGAILLLPLEFAGVLIAYYSLTLAYSLWLKRQMAVDVIILAVLYTVRIIAGAAAFGLPLTFWILAFSMFIFLSLALVKRYAELREARSEGRIEKTRGRGYYPDDLEMISSLGAASGYIAVMVLALYIRDQGTMALYSEHELIWLACPLLLFWVTRVWMLTHRGQMHDDPVVFAIRDRVSLIVGALFCMVFWGAA